MAVDKEESVQQKKDERFTFLFLTMVIIPLVAVAVVASYGFIVWFSQLLLGPPSL